MQALKPVTELLLTPVEYANGQYQEAIQKESFPQSILPRLLFVVQAIISLFSLILLPLACAIQLFTEKDRLDTLKETFKALSLQTFFVLPVSLLCAFAPAKFASDTTTAYENWIGSTF